MVKSLQLKRLEAYGFKSFADKLDIEFDKGITAIVGPNGSGKSNITDAIRWALGEQNVRNLRGSKTEDIIFTGSAGRRALGVAEVSLTFGNHDGKLPVEFAEVVVTRRLFRSGESEFYINKARSRLKDIYDLFADTGLGRDAISVISQNKIDQVLNSRPEERRLLFEEAAGITKYRNRKRESLRKLEDTQQNILRVNDILSEIENQLGPLAENAEKTRKYNVLREEYKRCRLTLLLERYGEQKRRLTEAERQRAEADKLNHDGEVKLNLLEVEKDRLNNELAEVEKSLQLLHEKNSGLSGRIEKNNMEITLAEERIRQSEESEHHFTGQIERLSDVKAEAEEKLQESQAAMALLEEKEAKQAADIEGLERQGQEILGKIKQAEESLANLREKALAKAQALTAKQNEAALLARDAAEKERQHDLLAAEAATFDEDLKKKLKEFGELQEVFSALAARIREAKEAQASYEGQLQEKNLQRQALAEKIAPAAESLAAAKARLRFLQGLQTEYEGFGRGVKGVLKNSLPWHKSVCGAVAEVIGMEAAYVTAVEIALGAGLQNVIVEDDQTAKEAIAYLKREKLGRVTFLPLNTINHNSRKYQDSAIVQNAGIIGYASDLVACDEKYRGVVDFLLGRTVVAKDIDAALALAKRQQFRVKIVTLAGDMVHPGGAMTGGSQARREAGFLNRAGEIKSLTEQIEKTQAALTGLQRQRETFDLEMEETRRALQEKIDAGQDLAVRYAEKKVYLEKAAAEQESGKRYIISLEEKMRGLRQEAASLSEQLAARRQEIGALEPDKSRPQDGGAETAAVLAGLQVEKEANAQKSVAAKIEKTVMEQEKIRLAENGRHFRQALEKNNEDIAAARLELERLLGGRRETQRALLACREENAKLKALRAVGVKDYDNFHRVKLEKLVQIQKQEQELKELRRRFHELQGRIRQAEILFAKCQYELEACTETLEKEYGLSVEEALPLKLEESAASLSIRTGALERDMEALGAVNPNAIDEYENLGRRYGFIKKQAEDLIVAKDYLQGIIKEIDVTMSKQFTEAFADISRYFSEIFERLFGGGRAKLELTDKEQALESGVEISVQPPNKKLQGLSVLSGGERALTVIALLFSFLRFRPAPFSVVDEIDAPLDEANVDRFASFLKEYAENTQFIVVTHRKGTMQAADVMHGVTVEDSGVSKIISVKLEEAAGSYEEA